MKKLISILFLLISVNINAQILKVSADKNPALVGEQILIQYSIDSDAKNFKSPNFNGLQVLSGPNPSRQSSYSFVNGKSQQSNSTTYSFYLKARKEGTYSISPATITVGKKKIKSKKYELKIIQNNTKNSIQDKTLSKNLYIKVEASKKNIVVGEQILVTYKLFTRLDLQNPEVLSLPSLNGFWVKDLKTSNEFKRDIVDGVAYYVADVKKSVLTAQKSGELILDPMELRCHIRIQNKQNSRDPFANFFGGGYNLKEETIKSKPIKISVSGLPSPPPNFEGAVGNMKLKSEIDKTNTIANHAVTYTITITGTGNIELIKPLTVKFPESFEVYDPKITEKIFEGGRKRSIKKFEYLLIPRDQGEYTIPSVELIVYNSRSKTYEIKNSDIHKLNILENKHDEDNTNSNNQRTIKYIKKDINYIATKTQLNKINSHVIKQNIFYFIFFTTMICVIILLFYDRIINRKETDTNNIRNKKANKIALKRLKKAQKCIANEHFDGFFEEIEKSLWGYFADKFKIQIAELSKETINSHFQSSSIDNKIKNQFISLLDECEFARYAPISNKNAQMDALLEKAKNIIIKVETALK